ncbi:MAG TPA: sulfatase-like hydrolase/transferase, partial [Planctomycetaceae bacterium]|nr:sulfatase-like hydrolase/transferase [Planctomycetaceae bacterium]
MHAVILTFDRLPARFLGCYGAEDASTPHFDRLAAESAVFDAHFAENADAQAAGHAWWTGRYHFPHPSQVQRDLPSILVELEAAGVRTALVSEANMSPPAPRFSESKEVDGRDGLDVSPEDVPFARLIAGAEESLSRMAEPAAPPSLLWLRSRGVARPWLPPREFAIEALADAGLLDDDDDDADSAENQGSAKSPRADRNGTAADRETLDSDLEAIIAALIERLEDRRSPDPQVDQLDFETLVYTARAVYAGSVSLLDWGLGRLLEMLERRRSPEPLLLIVTSALGESLGETVGLGQRRSEFEHGSRLASEITQTPLILQIRPDGPNGRTGALAQCVDLAPTLLEWFGIPADRFPLDGRSLLPVARGESPAIREFACMGDGPRRAIRTADFLLVSDGGPEGPAGTATP